MEALLKYRNTRGLSRTNRNTDKSFSIDKDKTNARPPHTMIQPKLELTTPGESYEQEADRMADFVMRKAFSGDNGMPQEHTSRTSALPPIISRQTDGFSSGLAIDPATESGINASRGGGQPLPDALRAKMESGFGTDFSGVRLHTDSQAADLSSSLQAKAFTCGNDIFFNSGQYNAQSATGQHLIAHELTHVAQQSGKVGREDLKSEPESIALIFYGKGGVTDIEGKLKHDVGTAYEKSAKSACDSIEGKRDNPNPELAHFPNSKIKCEKIYAPTKNRFFEKIGEQLDNSISYIGIYSHGEQDQIILGGFERKSINHNFVDIDIHFNDIDNNEKLLQKKLKMEL